MREKQQQQQQKKNKTKTRTIMKYACDIDDSLKGILIFRGR